MTQNDDAGQAHRIYVLRRADKEEWTAKVRSDDEIAIPCRSRTAWHTHPLGQTLIVMGGSGLAQREGGLVEQIRPGDVVWFAPGEKHWHGAAPR